MGRSRSPRQLAGRLRTRVAGGPSAAAKEDAELRWWLEHWVPPIRDGGFSPPDALRWLPGETAADSYAGRRWQQARAEVARVRDEAGISEEAFFAGKVVVDIGPGALGFPDAVAREARLAIGIDPLAERYRAAGLLLDGSDALYLTAGAEAIPLTSGCADVVLARNSLDHVEDPPAAVREMRRLLTPGGSLVLNFDVGHTPTATEPHSLALEQVKGWLAGMQLVHERAWPHSHGGDGQITCLVARAA